MIYAEAAYFDGNHCQHVAAYQDHANAKRRTEKARVLIARDRRTGSRARHG